MVLMIFIFSACSTNNEDVISQEESPPRNQQQETITTADNQKNDNDCLPPYRCSEDEDAQAIAQEEERKKAEEEAKKKAEEELLNNPEKYAVQALHKVFGETNSFDDNDSISRIIYDKNKQSLYIEVFGHDNIFSGLIKDGMIIDTSEFLEDIKDYDKIKDININILFPMVDKFGNSENVIVMKFKLTAETRNKINWENFDYNNLPDIADDYFAHPALN